MKITAEALRTYMDRQYAPQRIVISLAGPLDPAEVESAVAAQFGDLAARAPQRYREAPPPSALHRRMRAKRGEQAHVVIAYRAIPNAHPDRYTLDMLNAVLGEGMSSRLFLELRMEDTGGVCRWIAGQELLLGHIRSVEEIAAIIDSITAEEIHRVAQTYLRPELAYTTVVGPQTALAT